MEKAFAGIFGGTARLRLGAHGKGRNFGPGLERSASPGTSKNTLHSGLPAPNPQLGTWTKYATFFVL